MTPIGTANGSKRTSTQAKKEGVRMTVDGSTLGALGQPITPSCDNKKWPRITTYRLLRREQKEGKKRVGLITERKALPWQ